MAGWCRITRKLREMGHVVLTVDRSELTTDATNVGMWVADNKPDCIVLAAAKVEDSSQQRISVQSYRTTFDSSQCAKSCNEANVPRLLFLGLLASIQNLQSNQ